MSTHPGAAYEPGNQASMPERTDWRLHGRSGGRSLPDLAATPSRRAVRASAPVRSEAQPNSARARSVDISGNPISPVNRSPGTGAARTRQAARGHRGPHRVAPERSWRAEHVPQRLAVEDAVARDVDSARGSGGHRRTHRAWHVRRVHGLDPQPAGHREYRDAPPLEQPGPGQRSAEQSALLADRWNTKAGRTRATRACGWAAS